MYLSRLELDLTRRSTMMALAAPQKFHGAIERSFERERERQRHLWRIDRLGGKLFVLILSEEEPDLSGMASQFGTKDSTVTRSYDPLLQRIKEGSCWRFRLRANPTRHSSTDDGTRGRVKACGTIEEQRRWLLNHAEEHGFHVNKNSFDVTESYWCRFSKKGKQNVSILSVTYEGVLEVTDAEKFKELLCSGIGRGKAYGMGMMTVIS